MQATGQTVPRELRSRPRGVLQAAGDNVTVVETALQLRTAVAEGASHIEIRAHLDLTALDGGSNLGAIPPGVKSIRVWHPML